MRQTVPVRVRAACRGLSHRSVRALARGDRSVLDEAARDAGVGARGSVQQVTERLWGLCLEADPVPEIVLRGHVLAAVDWAGDAVVSEARAGTRRADLLTVTGGGATAWEIKSGYDRLDRLAGQVSAYGRTWEQVAVLTEPAMVEQVVAAVPSWCGVCTRQGVVRPPAHDASRTQVLAVLDTLRQGEALGVLELLGRPAPAVAPALVRTALREVFAGLDPADVRRAASAVVRRGRAGGVRGRVLAGLPAGLVPAAAGTRLTLAGWRALEAACRKEIHSPSSGPNG